LLRFIRAHALVFATAAVAVLFDLELEVRVQFLIENALARRFAEGIDEAQQERA
jgi:hypothetical protein